MKLNGTKFYINQTRGTALAYNTNLLGKWGEEVTYGTERYTDVDRVYYNFKYDSANKEIVLDEVLTKYGVIRERTAGPKSVGGSKKMKKILASSEVDEVTLANLKVGIQGLMNFFSEFEFEPNFRFVNTFSRCLQKSAKTAKDYVTNYFKLTDSPFTSSIVEKMKSYEFTEIMDKMKSVAPTKVVNSRFKIYYGPTGTGKTTDAMGETGDVCMVCHSAMLPSDLLEDFKFEDGKATFTPSALQDAMVNGTKILLDEINLLPFESVRFLQTVLDGKKEFVYKGRTIKIADGFQVIGTMNLTVNGSVYSVPEPLVDRCEEIREYKLTADSLLGAII